MWDIMKHLFGSLWIGKFPKSQKYYTVLLDGVTDNILDGASDTHAYKIF